MSKQQITMSLEGQPFLSLQSIIPRFSSIFRCGYLIFSQEGSHSDLDDGKNYEELLRVITTAVKNKRRCQGLCS